MHMPVTLPRTDYITLRMLHVLPGCNYDPRMQPTIHAARLDKSGEIRKQPAVGRCIMVCMVCDQPVGKCTCHYSTGLVRLRVAQKVRPRLAQITSRGLRTSICANENPHLALNEQGLGTPVVASSGCIQRLHPAVAPSGCAQRLHPAVAPESLS